MAEPEPAAASGFRLKPVVWFLAITFGLSWGIDLAIALTVGHAAFMRLNMSPVQMLIPACATLAVQRFVLKEGPLYPRRDREPARRLLTLFPVLALIYAAVIAAALMGDDLRTILPGVGSLLLTLWVLLAFFLYTRSGADGFERVGLQLGQPSEGIPVVFGIIIFLLGGAALNGVLGLGPWQGRLDHVYSLPIPSSVYPLALIVLFVSVTAIGLPLSQIAAAFGEEYGWRGFLQTELVKLGTRRGVLLVGIIWGVWHFPVILAGVHTYPPSALGLLLALVFFVLWGFIQSYAVLKTGSIWPAAFMHGLVNSVYAFTLTCLVRPYDPVLSFGLGVFGLAVLALAVLWILRDTVWSDGQVSSDPARRNPIVRSPAAC